MNRIQILFLLIILPVFGIIGFIRGLQINKNNLKIPSQLPQVPISPTESSVMTNIDQARPTTSSAVVSISPVATPAGMIRVELLDGPWYCAENSVGQVNAARDYLAQAISDLKQCVSQAATLSAQNQQEVLLNTCETNLESIKGRIDSNQKVIETNCQKI
ncbi:hypothetical protein A2154_05165 [Candidatus Gottesmanbacteria bacterium RBG_16_43_7]|uniref:Uncharacterized protein n=1 Tax=Candidatus Gottesmanbacteria bacterium RBG_16_43_7 TaxID=1798373 RepID=A0A1F5ZC32_9BACT|nr:MAG: hypothetical protein A2154_05165 [Candidatus Gottesmanbacteria bacterium RBG_16_43_7]